jgi:hypothetical protein
MSKMTYREEFPDFDPATMPSIPAGWTDQSWHNDTCPSFYTSNGKVVFVDFADVSLREWQDGKRFNVKVDPEIADFNEFLLETDDWQEVLKFVEA